MALQKNVAGQKYRVFAFNKTTSNPQTGDAANITAKIGKDFAAAGATDDVNPTEVEDGYYDFDLTQAETNANVIDFLPESSTANIQVIGIPGRDFTVPEDHIAKFDAIKLKTDTIGSGTVTVVSPVATDLSISLIRGDDYKTINGRELSFSNAAGTWPDLTGAIIILTARNRNAKGVSFSGTGSVITPTGANQNVTIDIEGDNTASLPTGAYSYDVQATLADQNTVTLVLSSLTLKEDSTT